MIKFKVKKNKHFFRGSKFGFIRRNKCEFNTKVFFHENCRYKLSENYDQINKLFGWSYNLFPYYDKELKTFKPGHHKNSVRFGWRCVDGEKIEIMSYVYINKIRKWETLIKVDVCEWVHLNFKETNNYYIFKVIKENGDSSIAKFKKSVTKKGFLGLFISRLYPYFGGRIPAPNDMKIELKYFKKFI